MEISVQLLFLKLSGMILMMQVISLVAIFLVQQIVQAKTMTKKQIRLTAKFLRFKDFLTSTSKGKIMEEFIFTPKSNVMSSKLLFFSCQDMNG
jgi:hypothetical protein